MFAGSLFLAFDWTYENIQVFETFRSGSVSAVSKAMTQSDSEKPVYRPWTLVSTSPNNEQFLVVYQGSGNSRMITLVMRERQEDTVSEDWLEIPLDKIQKSIREGREIMSVKMIDRFEEDIKKKYLVIVFSGGIVASMSVHTPLHSDLLYTLMTVDDDLLFEGIISLVFLLIFLVSVILKRRRDRNYIA
jgi:hypothetical protein